jgi:D-alanine-D-alanine ligase
VAAVPVTEDIRLFVSSLDAVDADLVFNLCEGIGEFSAGEYCVAALLELLDLPYTGSGPVALALALDKPTAKRLFAAAGLPTPAFSVSRNQSQVPTGLSYPLILKLANEDASLGITSESVVVDEAACRARLKALFDEHHAPVLAEEFIDGREFTVAIIDREPIVLEEIVFSVQPRIVSYRAKWVAGSVEDVGTRAAFNPMVAPAQQAEMFELAARACEAIGTRDYSRVDFRMTDRGELYILEVNPNPDITPGSGYRGALEAAGVPFADFVGRIVAAALKRRETAHAFRGQQRD